MDTHHASLLYERIYTPRNKTLSLQPEVNEHDIKIKQQHYKKKYDGIKPSMSPSSPQIMYISTPKSDTFHKTLWRDNDILH